MRRYPVSSQRSRPGKEAIGYGAGRPRECAGSDWRLAVLVVTLARFHPTERPGR